MATVTLGGVVTKVELRTYTAHDSGWYGQEIYQVRAVVAFRTDDGKDYWFDSPPARQSVNTSGPHAVAVLHPNDWVTKQRWECEGVAGAPGFGNTATPRVKVGDRIQISGRFKKDTRFGPQLWYVKRLDFNLDKLRADYCQRLETARKAVDPGQVEFPLTPHNQEEYVRTSLLPKLPAGWEWRICGGPDGLYFADPELKDTAKFLSAYYGAPIEQCQLPE
jgi:hypothetical protein